MIIDVHGHIGAFADRSIVSERLIEFVESGCVDRVLISNLDAASHGDGAQDIHEADANLACLDLHRTQPKLLPVYWVRVGRFDSDVHAYAGALDSEPFLAALFAPHRNGFGTDDPELTPYLAVLGDAKKPAIFLTDADEPARPTAVYTLAKRYPHIAFLLSGVSSGPAWREALDCIERSVLRRDARLYLESSNASADEMVEAIQVVGDDHLLFGSDAVTTDQHTESCKRLLSELREKTDRKVFQRVTSENACRLFGI